MQDLCSCLVFWQKIIDGDSGQGPEIPKICTPPTYVTFRSNFAQTALLWITYKSLSRACQRQYCCPGVPPHAKGTHTHICYSLSPPQSCKAINLPQKISLPWKFAVDKSRQALISSPQHPCGVCAPTNWVIIPGSFCNLSFTGSFIIFQVIFTSPRAGNALLFLWSFGIYFVHI